MFPNDRLSPPGLPPARHLPGTTAAIRFALDPDVVNAATASRAGMKSVRPPWKSDIEWLGPDGPGAHRRFEALFELLAIPERVVPFLRCDNQVRMSGGFVVRRSRCEAPDFHTDFKSVDGQAMTLITPIGDVPAAFGLLYYDDEQRIRTYAYRQGEAIIFGEAFLHSTCPGTSDPPVELLSFTFGTDRMQDWPSIRSTVGYQSELVSRPDGQLIRALRTQRWRRRLLNLARRLGLRKTP